MATDKPAHDKGGRPSKYTPELIERAIAYVDGGWADGETLIPSVAGLAVHLDVRRETLHVWALDPEKEQFSNILGKLFENQENILLQNGLANKFNSTITKLVLSKHGYSDKIEQDNTSSDGTMTPKAGLDASRLSSEALKEILDASKPK